MGTQLLPGGVEALMARADMFNLIRDNMGLFMLDKTSEEMKNVSAPLGGLGELKSQSLENICSVSRIPLVKYTGISPKGLNASSEGEIQVYDDTIGAYQERTMRAPLKNVIDIQQLSLWGEIDPEITFHFEPLRVMTDKERAEKQKMDVDRDETLVDIGAISPEEVRHRVINDPDLPYTGLDPDDVPEPPAEEGVMGQGESDPDDGGGGGSEGGSGGGFGEKV
jgi:phage-related protein (TIGR01555 family)